MYKKGLHVVLILLLSLSMVLSACSSSSNESGSSSNETSEKESEPSKEAVKDEVVEISMMMHPAENDEDARIRQEEIVDPFEALHPNYKLKIIENADPDAITRQQLAAGVGTDIIMLDGPTSLIQFASAGYLLPLELYAKKYDWDEKFYDWAYDMGVYDGTLYGLPGAYETLVVWYNKDMFAEKGWEVPTNFAEFMSLNATIQESGTIPFAFGTTTFRPSNEWWLSLVYNSYLGRDEFKKVLKNEVPWTSDLVKKATQTWVDIWKKGYINDKQSHTISLDDAWYLFENEQTAMKMEGTWAIWNAMNTTADFEMDFFIMPSWRDGVEAALPMALGEAIGINNKTEQPEAAAAFLDFWYNMERATSEVANGTFLPLNGINLDAIENPHPVIVKAYEAMDGAFKQGNVGFASWTYWPPTAQQYLWDSIDSVFLDQLSVDDYLAEAQKRAEEDEANGLLFKFND